MGRGIITKIYDWGASASFDNATVTDWAAGLALVFIASFLWSRVIKQIVE